MGRLIRQLLRWGPLLYPVIMKIVRRRKKRTEEVKRHR